MATATTSKKQVEDAAIAKAMRGQAAARAQGRPTPTGTGPKVTIKKTAGAGVTPTTPTQKAARATAPVAATGKATSKASTPARRGRPTSDTSQAERVRQALIKAPTERPSVIAKETGVDPAYVWDIRKVMYTKGLIPMPASANGTAKKVAKAPVKATTTTTKKIVSAKVPKAVATAPKTSTRKAPAVASR